MAGIFTMSDAEAVDLKQYGWCQLQSEQELYIRRLVYLVVIVSRTYNRIRWDREKVVENSGQTCTIYWKDDPPLKIDLGVVVPDQPMEEVLASADKNVLAFLFQYANRVNVEKHVAIMREEELDKAIAIYGDSMEDETAKS